MKSAGILSLLLLSALSAGRLAAAFNPSSPLYSRLSGTVVVPAELRDRSFVVEAMINGRGPFRMLVDTGASVSVISPAVAEAVEARPPPDDDSEAVAINGLGDSTQVFSVLLDSLTLGTARFEGVPAAVTNNLASVSQVDGKKFDGLIGFSLFSDVVFALDFPGRRLVLSDGFPKGLPPVRAELDVQEVGEIPSITARLQGQDIQFAIDTGATANLSLPPDVAQTASWKAEPRPGAMISVLGETTREFIGRLNGEIHLGPTSQESPIASIIDGHPTIGVELLKHYCVVFDEAHDKMWLCAATDNPVPSRPVRSLGLCLLASNRGWSVAGTIPGSPAEGAGIAKGDMVTKIGGKPALNWSREQLDEWTNTHNKVALSVAHDATTRKFVLPTWNLVP